MSGSERAHGNSTCCRTLSEWGWVASWTDWLQGQRKAQDMCTVALERTTRARASIPSKHRRFGADMNKHQLSRRQHMLPNTCCKE